MEHDEVPRAARAGRGARLGQGGARLGQGGARLGQGAGRLARAGATRVRRAATADGAGESGMSALLGAHALHSAGDALLAVALAGTVFFSVPLGEARDRVALYLLLTLLPFSLLVPVAGPLLDRLRHGRRDVLAVSTGARGLVAWSMAGLTASIGLYPLALAALVLSRAYGVARSAALPRVRPPGMSPVKANARMNVASVASGSVAAAVGAGLGALVGAGWVLRLAGVVLLAGAVVALKLPTQVDEERAPRAERAPAYRLLEGPVEVQRALVTAVALRGLAGLLTIFLAFLLKGEGAAPLVVGTVLGAAVAGQLLGTGLASRLPEHVTARLTLASLVVPAAACLVTAVVGGPVPAAVSAGLTGLSYALSKFALDAVLQGAVPPVSTSGAFARSETGLQLAWALGGGLALLLPTAATVGFAVAAGVPLLGVVAGARASAGRSVLPRRGSRQEAPGHDAGPARGDGDADTVVVRAQRRDDRDDTVVVRVVHDDPDDTVVVRPGRLDRDETVVVRAVGDDPDDTVVMRPSRAGDGQPPRGVGQPPRGIGQRRPRRPVDEPRVPRPRDPRTERGSTLDRWRHQAGGPPPRPSRWRRDPS